MCLSVRRKITVIVIYCYCNLLRVLGVSLALCWLFVGYWLFYWFCGWFGGFTGLLFCFYVFGVCFDGFLCSYGLCRVVLAYSYPFFSYIITLAGLR